MVVKRRRPKPLLIVIVIGISGDVSGNKSCVNWFVFIVILISVSVSAPSLSNPITELLVAAHTTVTELM